MSDSLDHAVAEDKRIPWNVLLFVRLVLVAVVVVVVGAYLQDCLPCVLLLLLLLYYNCFAVACLCLATVWANGS